MVKSKEWKEGDSKSRFRQLIDSELLGSLGGLAGGIEGGLPGLQTNVGVNLFNAFSQMGMNLHDQVQNRINQQNAEAEIGETEGIGEGTGEGTGEDTGTEGTGTEESSETEGTSGIGGTGPDDDYDGDGIPNSEDPDDNNDGIPDDYEQTGEGPEGEYSYEEEEEEYSEEEVSEEEYSEEESYEEEEPYEEEESYEEEEEPYEEEEEPYEEEDDQTGSWEDVEDYETGGDWEDVEDYEDELYDWLQEQQGNIGEEDLSDEAMQEYIQDNWITEDPTGWEGEEHSEDEPEFPDYGHEQDDFEGGDEDYQWDTQPPSGGDDDDWDWWNDESEEGEGGGELLPPAELEEDPDEPIFTEEEWDPDAYGGHVS